MQVRGNLRAPRNQVLDVVFKGFKQTFQDKYQVFLVQDPDSEEEDPKGGPRYDQLLHIIFDMTWLGAVVCY